MSSPKLCLPPSPSGYPLIGDLPHLRGDEMLWEKLAELRKTYGDIFILHLGSLKMLVVCGYRLVKKMLVDQADRFKYRPQWLVEVKTLHLSNGIVWSNGFKNEELRKFVMPALLPGLGAQTMEQKIRTEAEHLVEEILATTDLTNSDKLRELVYRATCNIKCAVIFGQRFRHTDPDFVEFMTLMDQMLQRHGVKNLKNFFPILQLLPTDSRTKHLIEVLSHVKEFLHKQVVKAEETFDSNNLRGVIDLFIARKQDETSSKTDITEDTLTHICRDLFVAGAENITSTVLWLFGNLLKHEHVHEKCRENITQVVGDKKNITTEDVNKMTYVQATINEVFRTANVAPLSVPHATLQDEQFEGYTIPKETMVLTHLVSVHNDPDYWENPELFHPERFIHTDGTLTEKEAFFPFSTGPRYCFAKRLARMEISMFFVEILRNLKMTSQNKPSLKSTQPGAFVEPETFGIHFSRI